MSTVCHLGVYHPGVYLTLMGTSPAASSNRLYASCRSALRKSSMPCVQARASGRQFYAEAHDRAAERRNEEVANISANNTSLLRATGRGLGTLHRRVCAKRHCVSRSSLSRPFIFRQGPEQVPQAAHLQVQLLCPGLCLRVHVQPRLHRTAHRTKCEGTR